VVGALMAALGGATSHKPFTSPGADKVTVYVETSAKSVAPMAVITCRQLTTQTAAGSVKSQ